MNILLITPKMPSNMASFLNIETDPYGGWIDGLVNSLKSYKNINLQLVTFNESNVDSCITAENNNIKYHSINFKSSSIIERFFLENAFDIYHVIGIEHSYIKYIIPYLPINKTLLGITGLNFECANHYFDDIESSNLILKANISFQAQQARKKGEIEKKAIQRFKYVTGRTVWDKRSVLSVNPHIKYFNCNEILRECFYTSPKWSLSNIRRNTIYVSQASYTIKGGKMLISILAELKKQFPDFSCEIAGENILQSDSIMSKLNGSYGSYIKSLINLYHLEDNVHFIGQISASEVISKMLNTNVFLLTSSIENSSNSLQEAMLLGMPCVTSNVGGLPSIASNEDVLFYDFNDASFAASCVAKIFTSDTLSMRLGQNASKRIEAIADPKVNSATMVSIYRSILEDNNS